MAPDPLAALRLPIVPITPRPEFGAALRARVHAGLGLLPPTEGSEHDMTTTTRPPVMPALHYRDATEALRWLRDVLGLEQAWVEPAQGPVRHAELRWESGAVTINFKRGHYQDRGPTTVQLAVDTDEELDARYERATAAGARVFQPLDDNWDGSRHFMLQDPEGNLWDLSTPAPQA
jgi:uncharacterized glyoxalase superfamily protein PhnB